MSDLAEEGVQADGPGSPREQEKRGPRRPRPGRATVPRWISRSLFLAVAVLAATASIPGDAVPLALPSASPFLAIGSSIVGRTVMAVSLIAVPVLLLGAWRPRCFCRYACPLGTLHDVLGRFPPGRRWVARVPAFGGIIALTALFLTLFKVPLLLCLDPLVIFSGLCHGYSYPDVAYLGILVLMSSIFLPGLWCLKLCPLGATQDALHWPLKTFKKSQQVHTQKNSVQEDRMSRARRRRFLGQGTLAALGAAGIYLGVRRPRLGKARNARLRPPGARESPPFFSLCIRCGGCMAVCPTRILRPDRSVTSWETYAVPHIDFSDGGACEQTCRRCNQVCPSGAIELLTLAEKNRRKIGVAQLEMELCVLYYDQECRICQRECPYEAIDYRWSEELYCQIPVINQKRCNGCGACRPRCPGTNHWEREKDPDVPERKALEIVSVRQ